MENENTSRRVHCLVLTYPAQGHINPMLQFSKRLQHKGLKVTFITTRFVYKTTMQQQLSTSIDVDTISDGYDQGGQPAARTTEEYLAKFKEIGSKDLAEMVERFGRAEYPVRCIVYDPFLPWALDVAKGFGLIGAAFFTQSCAVGNIYHHAYEGKVRAPISNGDEFLFKGGLPPLGILDLPSFLSDTESPPIYLQLLVNQFSNLGRADWLLCNSFHQLEEEVVDWMAKIWPLRTIGPTVPSMYLDRRLGDDREYGLSMFNPKSSSDYMNWLDQKPDRSVIYVSFGSLAQLGAQQMEEIARGLRNSNFYFLWVVRSTEESKLPKDFVKDITSEIGLIVPWCSQLQVLAHKAIGCFLTHCGWNSTLEALSLGVPMVGMPHWSDQATNAKYVVDVWGVGLRLYPEPDPNGNGTLVRREQVEKCIREIMEEGREEGEIMRRNARKWKELAVQAVDEGGSSDRNIDEFVASLLVHKC